MSFIWRLIKRASEEVREKWIRRCLNLPWATGQVPAQGPGSVAGMSAFTTAKAATAPGAISMTEALEEGEVWSPLVGVEEEECPPTKEVPGWRSA